MIDLPNRASGASRTGGVSRITGASKGIANAGIFRRALEDFATVVVVAWDRLSQIQQNRPIRANRQTNRPTNRLTNRLIDWLTTQVECLRTRTPTPTPTRTVVLVVVALVVVMATERGSGGGTRPSQAKLGQARPS